MSYTFWVELSNGTRLEQVFPDQDTANTECSRYGARIAAADEWVTWPSDPSSQRTYRRDSVVSYGASETPLSAAEQESQAVGTPITQGMNI